MKQSTPPEQQANPTGPSPESGESRALTTRQAARRRLLGATLGAPVIYTIAGAAGAATARSSTCDNNPGSVFTNVHREDNQITANDGENFVSCTLDEPDENVSACWDEDNREYWYENNGNGEALYTNSCWSSLLNYVSATASTKVV